MDSEIVERLCLRWTQKAADCTLRAKAAYTSGNREDMVGEAAAAAAFEFAAGELRTVQTSADNLCQRNAILEDALSTLLRHIVSARDGIDGKTVLRVTDCPVPLELAQAASDLLAK